jgi:acyl-CoA synthetase (AMP-forming)/AMP-acid ligase II
MNIPLTPIRFLRYAEQQYPRRTAVVCGKERFTYAELADRAGRLAGALRKAGVREGDRVAFLSANCHRLLEAYYGVIEAGAVLLPLNIRLAAEELAYILNDAGARLLFLQAHFLPFVESFRSNLATIKSFYSLDSAVEEHWLSMQSYEALLAEAPRHQADITQVDENALAELFYTSGTSAEPKGVMLTHRNVHLHALNASLALHTDNESVELHTIPLFHANGWGAAHFLTLLGGKHVMIPRFDPPEVFRLIESERVQYCSLVPAMATALVNCPERTKYDLSSLRRITIGGAASSPMLIREVEEKLGCICFSGYGLTETSPVLSLSPMKPGLGWEKELRCKGQAMTGYAIPGTELRVVDANDQDVPRDGHSIGEIISRSDGVMAGYWQQPEATALALSGGWFRTGDMATWNEDGYILIVDRKKDLIVSGGENISSLEVEKTLLSHPAVLEVAVVPVPDKKWGEVPKALVVLKPGMQAGEIELIEHCRLHLAHYKCPQSVEFLESLPRTGTGKVLKRELRKKYWQGRETLRPRFAEPEASGPGCNQQQNAAARSQKQLAIDARKSIEKE